MATSYQSLKDQLNSGDLDNDLEGARDWARRFKDTSAEGVVNSRQKLAEREQKAAEREALRNEKAAQRAAARSEKEAERAENAADKGNSVGFFFDKELGKARPLTAAVPGGGREKLQQFDKSGVVWGQQTGRAFKKTEENGSILIREASADLDGEIVKKDGNVYKAAKGLPWEWAGYDADNLPEMSKDEKKAEEAGAKKLKEEASLLSLKESAIKRDIATDESLLKALQSKAKTLVGEELKGSEKEIARVEGELAGKKVKQAEAELEVERKIIEQEEYLRGGKEREEARRKKMMEYAYSPIKEAKKSGILGAGFGNTTSDNIGGNLSFSGHGVQSVDIGTAKLSFTSLQGEVGFTDVGLGGLESSRLTADKAKEGSFVAASPKFQAESAMQNGALWGDWQKRQEASKKAELEGVQERGKLVISKESEDFANKTGLKEVPSSWYSEGAKMHRDAAKEAGQLDLEVPEGYALSGGKLYLSPEAAKTRGIVGEKGKVVEAGSLKFDGNGVPYLEVKGDDYSPSRLGDSLRGVKEYATMPSSIAERAQEEAIAGQTGADSEALARKAWEGKRWSADKVLDFVNRWNEAANDSYALKDPKTADQKRVELLMELGVDLGAERNSAGQLDYAVILEKGGKVAIDAGYLYSAGYVSKQEARLISSMLNGYSPYLKDVREAQREYLAKGKGKAAEAYRKAVESGNKFEQGARAVLGDTAGKVVGGKLKMFNPLVGAFLDVDKTRVEQAYQKAAVNEFFSKYIKENEGHPDFDRKAVYEARQAEDSFWGKDAGKKSATWVESTLLNAGASFGAMVWQLSTTALQGIRDARGGVVGFIGDKTGLDLSWYRNDPNTPQNEGALFVSDDNKRLAWDNTKMAFRNMIRSGLDRGGDGGANLWDGKVAGKTNKTIDELFEKVGRDGTLSEEDLGRLTAEVEKLSREYDAIGTRSDQVARGKMDGEHDLTKNGLLRYLVAYKDTLDPSYKQAFKDGIFMSKTERELQEEIAAASSVEGLTGETDAFSPAFQALAGANTMPYTETGVEAVSMLGLGALSKGLTVGKWAIRANKGRALIGGVDSAITKFDDLLAKAANIGNIERKLGQELGAGAKAWNAVRSGTITVAAGSVSEFGEEVVAAMGQAGVTGEEAIEQGFAGLVGGMGQGGMMHAGGSAYGKYKIEKLQEAQDKALQKFVDSWNANEGKGASVPLTVETVKRSHEYTSLALRQQLRALNKEAVFERAQITRELERIARDSGGVKVGEEGKIAVPMTAEGKVDREKQTDVSELSVGQKVAVATQDDGGAQIHGEVKSVEDGRVKVLGEDGNTYSVAGGVFIGGETSGNEETEAVFFGAQIGWLSVSKEKAAEYQEKANTALGGLKEANAKVAAALLDMRATTGRALEASEEVRRIGEVSPEEGAFLDLLLRAVSGAELTAEEERYLLGGKMGDGKGVAEFYKGQWVVSDSARDYASKVSPKIGAWFFKRTQAEHKAQADAVEAGEAGVEAGEVSGAYEGEPRGAQGVAPSLLPAELESINGRVSAAEEELKTAEDALAALSKGRGLTQEEEARLIELEAVILAKPKMVVGGVEITNDNYRAKTNEEVEEYAALNGKLADHLKAVSAAQIEVIRKTGKVEALSEYRAEVEDRIQKATPPALPTEEEQAAQEQQQAGEEKRQLPPPLTEDKPIADRKARAKMVWDNAKVGDVYEVNSGWGNYTVTIKANKKTGLRYAEVTGENGKLVDIIPIDREGHDPTIGQGLIFGAEMVLVHDATASNASTQNQQQQQTPAQEETQTAQTSTYEAEVRFVPFGATNPSVSVIRVEAESVEDAKIQIAEKMRSFLKLDANATVTEPKQVEAKTQSQEAPKASEEKAGGETPAKAAEGAGTPIQLADKVAVQEWTKEGVRTAIKTAAAVFGYKIVDTGINIGIKDRWGNVVNLGTQLYDKLNPGSEIGQFIDNIKKNSPVADEILGQISKPNYHRVWFGHDFATNLGLIVDKFGWAGVPDYIGQLLKDSLTKSGIPFPGVELLVRGGIVSDKVATEWLSANIGEVLGGSLAFFGTYKLYKAAKGNKLNKVRVVFATIGASLKLVGGVWTAQPFLILSGLGDVAILVTHLGDIREAFKQSKKKEDAKVASGEEVQQYKADEIIPTREEKTEAKTQVVQGDDSKEEDSVFAGAITFKKLKELIDLIAPGLKESGIADFSSNFYMGFDKKKNQYVTFSQREYTLLSPKEKKAYNIAPFEGAAAADSNRNGEIKIIINGAEFVPALNNIKSVKDREAFVRSVIAHEMRHYAQHKIKNSAKRFAELWDGLPRSIQEQVEVAYNAGEKFSSSAWAGMEFERMVWEAKFGRTTEQIAFLERVQAYASKNATFAEKFAEIIADIARFIREELLGVLDEKSKGELESIASEADVFHAELMKAVEEGRKPDFAGKKGEKQPGTKERKSEATSADVTVKELESKGLTVKVSGGKIKAVGRVYKDENGKDQEVILRWTKVLEKLTSDQIAEKINGKLYQDLVESGYVKGKKNIPANILDSNNLPIPQGYEKSADGSVYSLPKKEEQKQAEVIAGVTIDDELEALLGQYRELLGGETGDIPQAKPIKATPEFISTATALINALWVRGVNTPERFTEFMVARFADKVDARILAQTWILSSDSDITKSVNWYQLYDNAIGKTAENNAPVENKQTEGQRYTISTPIANGIRTEIVYDVVPLEELRGMAQLSLSGTQTRDRNSGKSQDQIGEIALTLDSSRLLESDFSDRGAPVVRNGVILSGNGRTLGIIKAFTELANSERVADYKKNAAEFMKAHGLEEKAKGMENPIVVRRAVSLADSEVEQFVKESNTTDLLAETKGEKGLLDFDAIKGILQDLEFTEEGLVEKKSLDIVVAAFNAANRPYEKGSDGVYDADELRKQITRAGLAGLFRNAGYVDTALLNSFLEATDSKRLFNAFLSRVGRLAVLPKELSLSDMFIEALANRRTALTQSSLFDENMNAALDSLPEFLTAKQKPLEERLAKFFQDNKNKPTKIKEFLDDFLDQVEYEHRERTTESQYGETDLFSSVLPRPKVDPEQALERAIAKVSGDGQTSALSSTDAGEGRGGDTETGNAGVSATEGIDQPVAPAPESEKKEEQQQADATKQRKAADLILGKIREGKAFDWRELFAMTDEAFGGTMAQGVYSVKDAYDAMELAINLHILQDEILVTAESDNAYSEEMRFNDNLSTLSSLLQTVPTQTKRSDEQDKMQQFSTPPTLGYVAAWVGNINASDTMLEPSAGIGGLGVYGKLAGAKVAANELSGRRREFLKEMGFDFVSGHDAELLNAWLTPDIKVGNINRPTVVVMNPPFSNSVTSGKMGDTRIGANHLLQSLQLLEEGGRLVAIAGEGMGLDSPAFKKWWQDLGKKYNIRANVWVDGKNYAKYGTTFSNRLLVIDKTGKTEDMASIVKGQVDKLEDLFILLEGVKNDRPRTSRNGVSESERKSGSEDGSNPKPSESSSEPKSDSTTQEEGDEASSNSGTRTSSSRGGAGGRGASNPSSKTKRNPSGGSNGVVGGGNSGQPLGRSDGSSGTSAGSSEAARPEQGLEVKSEIALGSSDETFKAAENEDDVFSVYRPSKAIIEGSVQHKAKLVESAAMGSIPMPDATYIPNLPKELITSGALSDVQLETIVYAGQAHEQLLEDGSRRGIFCGDGTGVGKGRQIAGIILDNQRQGRAKALWISENDGLMKDAKRDASDIGIDQKTISGLGKAGKPIEHNGILYATYSTLKQGHEQITDVDAFWTRLQTKVNGGAKLSRIEQVALWAGRGFDGVIAFDEAHNAGNAIATKGNRGDKKASKTGISVVDLQKILPNARVVYVSATGATEVENLSFADRLGIWGAGTPFANKQDFFNKIKVGGISALEIVARDLKAQGLYLSRSISYKGVEFDRLTQNLTPEQTEIYNKIAESWQVVLSNMDQAMAESGANNSGKARAESIGAFWSAQQNFFNQLLTSLQMPILLADMDRQLEDGKSVVLQIVNTYEAQEKRKVEQRKQETEEGNEVNLEDLDISPRDILLQFLRNSFPTQLYHEVANPSGEGTIWEMVKDPLGNPIDDPAAVEARDRLLAEVSLLKVPDSPLDQIYDKFGYDAIAEVTGRTGRIEPVKGEDGTITRQRVPRSSAARQVEAQEFQDGKRRILIFSYAGGTGFSFHASNKAKNKQRRVHYLVQPGWRADKALQGFGRTHRTDQDSAPIFKLVETNINGHKRFISTIARRLAQLGALTTGERKGKSGAIFSEKDNLESRYSTSAIYELVQKLGSGEIQEFTMDEFARSFGFVKTTPKGQVNTLYKDGRIVEDKIPSVQQFLNRVLALPLDRQNTIFNLFTDLLEKEIDRAIKNGTYDTGLQNYKADSLRKLSDEVVYTQEISGAKTRIVEVEEKNAVKFTQWETVAKYSEGREMKFYRNRKSGNVYAMFAGADKTTTSGSIVPTFRRMGISSFESVMQSSVKTDAGTLVNGKLVGQGNYEEISEDVARLSWEDELAKADKFRTNKATFVVGTILPIWDRLKNDRPQIYRATMDDGETLLGVFIPPKDVFEVRSRLGAKIGELDAKTVFSDILNNAARIQLANGIEFRKVVVSAERRIEVTGLNYSQASLLENSGQVFSERISFQTRYFVPNEEALGRFLKQSPILMRNGMLTQGAQGATQEELDAIPENTIPQARGIKRVVDNAGNTPDLFDFYGIHVQVGEGLDLFGQAELTRRKEEEPQKGTVGAQQEQKQIEAFEELDDQLELEAAKENLLLSRSAESGVDVAVEEEEELTEENRQEDIGRATELFNANMKLAMWFANKYRNINAETEDIQQEALIALWTAANKHDPTKGEFSAFASSVLRSTMNRLFQKHNTRNEDIAEVSKETAIGDGRTIEDTLEARIKTIANPEDVKSVLSVLDSLPEKAKAVWKAFLEGKDWRTIGSEFSMSHEGARKVAMATADTIKARLSKLGIASVNDVFPTKDEFSEERIATRKSNEQEDEENWLLDYSEDNTWNKENEGVGSVIPEAKGIKVDKKQIAEYLSNNGTPANKIQEESERISTALSQHSGGGMGSYIQGELFADAMLPGGASIGTDQANSAKKAIRANGTAASKDLVDGLKGDWDALAREVDSKGRASSVFPKLVKGEIPTWDIVGTKINGAKDLAALLLPIRSPYFESLKVAVLDKNNKVVHSQVVSVGSINESIADPKQIFAALANINENTKRKHTAIVLSHNHPTGDPTPSVADIALTSRLKKIAHLVGFEVLDHVITNGEKFYSFRNSGEKSYANPTKAEWEVVPRGDLVAIQDSGKLRELTKSLRNANPAAIDIVYLNTKYRVLGVERVEPKAQTNNTKLFSTILNGVAREGAFAIALATPQYKLSAAELKEFLDASSIKLLDLAEDGVSQTWRDRGVYEESGTYGSVEPIQPPAAKGIQSSVTKEEITAVAPAGSAQAAAVSSEVATPAEEARALTLAEQAFESLPQEQQALLQRVANYQIERVLEQWRGKPGFMLAPNGNPTNLTERQWAQVRTPLFKRWFGDWENDTQTASKVIDANGEPLEVWHGTPNGGWLAEDPVFKSESDRFGGFGSKQGVHWFADQKRMAATYADYRRAFNRDADPAIIPAFLRSVNPLIIDAKGQPWRSAQQRGKTSDVIQQALSSGNDGVIIRNVQDDYQTGSVGNTKLGTTFSVFSSNQIKSATDNNGVFTASNSIAMAKGIHSGEAPSPQTTERAGAEWEAIKGEAIKIGLNSPSQISVKEVAKEAAVTALNESGRYYQYFRGRYDQIDYFAPGSKQIILNHKQDEALAKRQVNKIVDGLRKELEKAFGYPGFFNGKGKKRMKEAIHFLLPVAARLEAQSIDKDGNFVWKEFELRAGTVTGKEAKKLKEGDFYAAEDGVEYRVGKYNIEEQGFDISATITPEMQEEIYRNYQYEYPEALPIIDRWITPGLTSAFSVGEHGTAAIEFNRYALHGYMNEWPQAIQDLFGGAPLPSVPYVSGYTPDVAAQKSIVSLIHSAITFKKYRSQGRKFKTGFLRRSGGTMNLIDGFSTRAMEAHREKVRTRFRQQLIENAVKFSDQVSVDQIESGEYVKLDDVYRHLLTAMEFVTGALDRKTYPHLTGALAPIDQNKLAKIVGDVAKLESMERVIHKSVFRELQLSLAREKTERGLYGILDWVLRCAKLGKLTAGSFMWNWLGNKIMQSVLASNRLYFGIISGVLLDGSNAKLGMRDAFFLMRGLITDMAPNTLNAGRIGELIPKELFSDTTALSSLDAGTDYGDIVEDLKKNGVFYTATEGVKTAFMQGGISAAILYAQNFNGIDVAARQQMAYALYRARAEAAADANNIKSGRKRWMRSWIEKQIADKTDIHNEIVDTVKLWLMDYQNVPSFLDPSSSLPEEKVARLVKAHGFWFAKWPFNIARWGKRMSVNSSIRLISPSTSKKERAEALANIITLCTLAYAGAAMLGGGDDKEEGIVGTRFDKDGNFLDRNLDASSRIRLNDKIGNLISTALKMAGVSINDDLNNSRNDDYWMYFRSMTLMPETLLLGRVATGDMKGFVADSGTYLSDMANLGILFRIAGLTKVGGIDAKDETPNYYAKLALEIAGAPINPDALTRYLNRAIDPVARTSKDIKKLGFDMGMDEAIKSKLPFLTKSLPAAGEYVETPLSPLSFDKMFKRELGNVNKDFEGGKITQEQRDAKISQAKASVQDAKEARRQRQTEDVAATLTAFGIDPSKVDRSGEASRDVIGDLQKLKKSGVGAESVSVYEKTSSSGKKQTVIAYPNPDSIQYTPPALSFAKILTGINLKPIPRDAYKESAGNTPSFNSPKKAKPKDAPAEEKKTGGTVAQAEKPKVPSVEELFGKRR